MSKHTVSGGEKAGIVTSDAVTGRRRLLGIAIPSSLVVIIGVVLLAAVLGGSAYLVVIKPAQSKQHNQQPVSNATLPSQLPAVQDAERLVGEGRHAQAQATLDKAIAKTTNDADKYALYFAKATDYVNQNNYAQAIAAFQSAAKFEQTIVVYEALGSTAEASGDKQLAIASYQKAVALFTSKDRPSDKQALEKKIKALGG